MYLGLDIGTTATKAALVDEHRAIVATATAGYSLYQPTPEISEFDPQAWIDAVRSVVAALRAEKRAALQAVRAIFVGPDAQPRGVGWRRSSHLSGDLVERCEASREGSAVDL
jgi:ribulose kinase